MTRPLHVRAARAEDATAIREIYRPWVEETAVSFEAEVPTAAGFEARIAAAQERHAWLVGERDGVVVGYAYGTGFRARAAYRWTAETAIYVAAAERGRGTGRALYGVLLETLRMMGFALAIGGMTTPNAASARLHLALGFERVGTFTGVGFKRGGWRSVEFFEKRLQPFVEGDVAEPPETVPFATIAATPAWREMVARLVG